MSNLAKKHAEVRLSAFQIVAELFPRSHLFRQLVVSDFQRLAELVTGTESRHPLPPPRPAATRLKESSLLAIRQWNDKFGEGYPKLKLGFNHLKHKKMVCSMNYYSLLIGVLYLAMNVVYRLILIVL